MKLRKKLLSVAAIATLALGSITVATASAASPTPGDTNLYVCQSHSGNLSFPVNDRCKPTDTRKPWTSYDPRNDYNGRGRTALVAPLQSITMNLGTGGGLKCWDNRSKDPKNPVFNRCVPTGQLAKVLNPAPQPTPTPIATPTATVRPTVRPSITPTPGPRR